MPGDLKTYRAKRDFERTPEPQGALRSRTAGRSLERQQFVVQKHAARRLHYDFRLEHDGVLKSWAVPKGPSLDPKERRLAVQTEDHPIEYAVFEGVIPQREYGGGAVLVWDRGYWSPEADPDKALAKGKLDFELHGEKLRGRWTLVRMPPRGKEKNNWLLIKRNDREARSGGAPELVETLPDSVLTGRGIAEVAVAKDRIWHSNGGEADGEEGAAHVPLVGRPDTVPGARAAALPAKPKLQVPTRAAQIPPQDGWFHEPRLAGERVLCRLENGAAALIGPSGKNVTRAYPRLAAALRDLPCRAALLDGSAVVFDRRGVSSAELLHAALGRREAKSGNGASRTATRTSTTRKTRPATKRASAEAPAGQPRGEGGASADVGEEDIVLVLFDLLHLDGWDLCNAQLRARKELLRLLLVGAPPCIRYGEHIEGHGSDFYRQACRLGLGAIVSKRAESSYRGGRSRSWLEIACGS